MQNRYSIGQARAGDYISLTRVVYTDVDVASVVSVTGSLDIMDSSLLRVASVPALVSSFSAGAAPPIGGRAALQLDYQVTIPDSVTPSADGDYYTAILSVQLITASGQVSVIDVQETFQVLGYQDVLAGAQPTVVLLGLDAELPYRCEYPPQTVGVDIYYGNTLTASFPNLSLVNSATVTWHGLQALFKFPTSSLPQASLMPYAAIWNVDGVRDIAPLFVINPSIYAAMKELHNWVNKNTSDWGLREITFTPEQLIAALYSGATMFNSEVLPTNFTMTNALAPIRFFWIQFSAVWLLQSQVLNGIETDFSFTSSAVTLDVDRAAKYQSFADTLLSNLKEQVRPLKVALSKRGQIDGDGSNNPLSLRHGAIGAISISTSPASRLGYAFNPMSWRSAFLNPGQSLMMSNF